jgi:hypothetical protein
MSKFRGDMVRMGLEAWGMDGRVHVAIDVGLDWLWYSDTIQDVFVSLCSACIKSREVSVYIMIKKLFVLQVSLHDYLIETYRDTIILGISL